FLFRSFYAGGNMQSSDGRPSGAVYLLGRLLIKILKSEQPAHFAFIMDGKGPHFRHQLFPEYKAQRSATPEDLVSQIEPVQSLVRGLGLRLIVSENCEADDCIASLAARLQYERPVVIIGADKDLKQCLSPSVLLWDPASKDEKITTLADFEQETGLKPEQWPDFQAVIGDSSDNIPGIPGVGPKTAAKIFADFPTLEKIKEGIANLPQKLQEKFKNNLSLLFTYRELTRLSVDCCPDIGLSELARHEPDLNALAELFEQFELFSLMPPAKQLVRQFAAGKMPEAAAHQLPPSPAADDSTQKNPEAAEEAPSATPKAQGISPARQTATRQISLFAEGAAEDSFAELPAPSPVILNEADLPGALPALNGKVAAILFKPGEWRIAVDDREYAIPVTGGPEPASAAGATGSHLIPVPPPGLTETLKQAALLITPDLKNLLLSCPDWRKIERWFDLGLAAYLLNPEERDYSWEYLAARFAHNVKISPDAPALLALGVHRLLSPRLEKNGLAPLLHELELPLIPVLARMQSRGIRLDLEAFADFLGEVQAELEQLTQKIYEQAGEQFNIRSSQQLQHILFERLALPKAGKTRGGALSTSQEALEKLEGRHPIIETILEFRKLEKMRSTYLEPFPQLVDTGERIHSSFNQLATATGRLSSSNPNLQNIPIRGKLGGRMRSCFVADPGKLLISADYSQIELRVLAHISQDPALLEAFRNGEDIHRSTAALLYEKAAEEISPDERRNAKTINFGIIYGMGAQKLARELKIPMHEAKDFITRYYAKLSTLKNCYDQIIRQAEKDGFVTTMAGRRRFIADINSANAQAISQARRQAVNTVIQGSAADIIKIAMLTVNNDELLNSMGAQLILQVHDELVVEAPIANASRAGERLAELMSRVAVNGAPLSVPLLVEWGMAENWDAAH
ncbi:MAG: DNA polymerase I, partial [Desulfovibrionaceae bacterium]|nr:DNA polymerase I [Desulfovibrionaceae bacterium]